MLKQEIAFSAKDFSVDSYDNPVLFPKVGIMRGGGIIECPDLSPNLLVNKHSNNLTSLLPLPKRSDLKRQGRQGEFFQEIGFIEMLRNNYPKTFTVVNDVNTSLNLELELTKNDTQGDPGTVVLLEDLIKINPSPRVFLPFCGFFSKNGVFGEIPLNQANNAISRLQKHIAPQKIFYVSPHPGTKAKGWESLINNARALKIDQCTRGFYNDITIPVSTMPSLCDYSSDLQKKDKKNLIYSCGAEHSKKYKGLRSEIPKIFTSLVNKTGIDMETKRSRDDYQNGFYNSKFCLVIPGDTTGTSQAARAMCAGCVPIFLALDFRDLPFSNILDLPFSNILDYTSFSIRIHFNYFLTNDTLVDYNHAENLYNLLQEMVVNGTYDYLKANVKIARDFFNYHRFGSRSPYGASFVSMYQDEVNEMKR